MSLIDCIREAAKSFGREFTKQELYDEAMKYPEWAQYTGNTGKRFSDCVSQNTIGTRSARGMSPFLEKTNYDKYKYVNPQNRRGNTSTCKLTMGHQLSGTYYGLSLDELERTLRSKINERGGIRELAKEMTSEDSNPEHIIIKFRSRGKRESLLLNNLLSFLKEANRKADGHFSSLIGVIESMIDSAIHADDAVSHDSEIKQLIIILLEAIIEYFTNRNINQAISSKADELYRNLCNNNVVLIEVLLGLYIDGLLNSDEDFPKSTIVLFLDNIRDTSNQNGYRFDSLIYTVFAHEYLHFHHYYSIYTHYTRFAPFAQRIAENDILLIDYIELMKRYAPGTVVMESLASYFEHEYSSQCGYVEIADNLSNSWHNHCWQDWPYSGARLIRDPRHFCEIFGLSLNSFDYAGQALGI